MVVLYLILSFYIGFFIFGMFIANAICKLLIDDANRNRDPYIEYGNRCSCNSCGSCFETNTLIDYSVYLLRKELKFTKPIFWIFSTYISFIWLLVCFNKDNRLKYFLLFTNNKTKIYPYYIKRNVLPNDRNYF